MKYDKCKTLEPSWIILDHLGVFSWILFEKDADLTDLADLLQLQTSRKDMRLNLRILIESRWYVCVQFDMWNLNAIQLAPQLSQLSQVVLLSSFRRFTRRHTSSPFVQATSLFSTLRVEVNSEQVGAGAGAPNQSAEKNFSSNCSTNSKNKLKQKPKHVWTCLNFNIYPVPDAVHPGSGGFRKNPPPYLSACAPNVSIFIDFQCAHNEEGICSIWWKHVETHKQILCWSGFGFRRLLRIIQTSWPGSWPHLRIRCSIAGSVQFGFSVNSQYYFATPLRHWEIHKRHG